jgi:hypothetical protein
MKQITNCKIVVAKFLSFSQYCKESDLTSPPSYSCSHQAEHVANQSCGVQVKVCKYKKHNNIAFQMSDRPIFTPLFVQHKLLQSKHCADVGGDD